MNSEERKYVVPTGEEITAKRSDPQTAPTRKSWVQKLKLRAHIGAGRRVQPPLVKVPTAKLGDPPVGQSLAPVPREAGTSVLSDLPSPTPSMGAAPPATESAPRPLGQPQSPAPGVPGSQAAPAKRPVRIRKDAIERRGGTPVVGGSSSRPPSDGPERVLSNGRCSRCGRFFDGTAERVAFRFVSHACGGRQANDDWRFDR